ncbi:MAG: agmatine deiminase family protein [Phycisphaerales bacterium]
MFDRARSLRPRHRNGSVSGELASDGWPRRFAAAPPNGAGSTGTGTATADDTHAHTHAHTRPTLAIPTTAMSLVLALGTAASTAPIAAADDAPTPAPLGTVTPVVESAPTESIMIAYEGPGSWKAILDQVAAHVTTSGDADIVVIVDSADERDEALSFMSGAGAVMERVRPIILETDSIWIRDYGPRPALESGIRVFADGVYNRPRPADDAFAAAWASTTGSIRYELPLILGGGNLVAFPGGAARATNALLAENPDLTPGGINGLLNSLLGVVPLIGPTLPESIDPTAHINTWMMPIESAVVVSEWPENPGSPQAIVCENAAAQLAAEGRTVVRTPARFDGGVHYTYTNALICNDLVLIPAYGGGVPDTFNAEAAAAWGAVASGRTVIPIEIDPLAAAGGGLHTVSLNLPAWTGGEAPRVRVQTPVPGTMLTPGETIDITWITDDDEGVVALNIFASVDGGQTFNYLIDVGTPDDGHTTWTVPPVFSLDARIRVTARDADGNASSDLTDGPLQIGMPPLEGDINGDGQVNFTDLVTMLGVWGPCPACPFCPADLDGDCLVGFSDLVRLLTNLS